MKTTHEYRGFVFTVEYHPQDPAYLVDFPDIPQIITSGPTLSQVFANTCEAQISIWRVFKNSERHFPPLDIDWK